MLTRKSRNNFGLPEAGLPLATNETGGEGLMGNGVRMYFVV